MKIPIISAALLFLSGILISISGAYFSVKGFTLLIPDPDIYIGLLLLAIGFEIGKITAATFLFHEFNDSDFPTFFKYLLTCAIAALIFLSAISTYSHLNSSISKSMSETNAALVQIETLNTEHNRIIQAITSIEGQISNLPTETKVSNRIRLINSYKTEKAQYKSKLDVVDTQITKLTAKNLESDQFIYLNALSNLLHVSRDGLFTIILLLIVTLIDPLAITLILSASFVVNKLRKDMLINKMDNIILPIKHEDVLSCKSKHAHIDVYNSDVSSEISVFIPTTFTAKNSPTADEVDSLLNTFIEPSDDELTLHSNLSVEINSLFTQTDDTSQADLPIVLNMSSQVTAEDHQAHMSIGVLTQEVICISLSPTNNDDVAASSNICVADSAIVNHFTDSFMESSIKTASAFLGNIEISNDSTVGSISTHSSLASNATVANDGLSMEIQTQDLHKSFVPAVIDPSDPVIDLSGNEIQKALQVNHILACSIIPVELTTDISISHTIYNEYREEAPVSPKVVSKMTLVKVDSLGEPQ